jgi:hypothetical protein
MGSTVHEAVNAATQLAEKGIEASVINVPSIRPCDTHQLLTLLKSHRAVVSVEEHNVNGGVGSLVAEVLAEAGCAIPLRRLGIANGGYAMAADRATMRAHHEIDAAGVVKTPRRCVSKGYCMSFAQIPIYINKQPSEAVWPLITRPNCYFLNMEEIAMPVSFKALIFDMDGTLFDTEPLHRNAWRGFRAVQYDL